MRSAFMFLGWLGLIILITLPLTANDESEAAMRQRAQELARQYIITDGHIDVPYRLREYMEDISVRTPGGDFDYIRAREGGLDVAFMSIFIPASYQESGGGKALADSLIDMVAKFAADWPDKFALVGSTAEVRRQFGKNKVLLSMGMENGAGVEGDLANLAHFYRRGIRYITLTHARANRICDSSYDENRKWNGLSPFGKQVVAEMNRLGIMIDVSHVTDSTFYQVIKLSKAPAVATHSSCRHFTPGWERNMSDEMIKLLAEKGGVININFGASFLKKEYQGSWKKGNAAIKAYLEEHHIEEHTPEAAEYYQQYRQSHPVGVVEDVVDHIDHVVKLVGVDYVGFGSDFDGVMALPKGLQDVSMYPNLIYQLLKRGYSEEDIKKICGENMLRVWAAVEKTAQELQSHAGK